MIDEVDIPSEPPKEATDWYALGVERCQLLGVPLSALRIYFPATPKRTNGPCFWYFNGKCFEYKYFERNIVSRRKKSKKKFLAQKIFPLRQGIWLEFSSLDEAKLCGRNKMHTKIGPDVYRAYGGGSPLIKME